jgi:undecaprenyl-diphosphatase
MVAGHRQVVYGLIFLLALSESLPVIGAMVPGTALIVGISALVPSGAVALWPLLICATLGAIMGDGVSYWLGHHYHRQITRRWPFSRYPGLIPRGEDFFRRHGGKSVFLARFTPGVRAVVPLVAGMARMSVIRFYSVNIASALGWAPLHVLSGALVGASLVLTGAVAERLAVFVILLLVALWLTARCVRLVLHRGLPWLAAAQNRVWSWARHRDTWVSRQILTLLDPQKKEIKGLMLSAVLLIVGAWSFFSILANLSSGDPLVRANSAVYHFLQGLRTVWGDRIMIVLTELGDGAVTTTVTGVVFLWLAWRRAWRPAAYWIGAVAFAAIFNTAMKLALHMPRPVAHLYAGWSAYSFPSGHTTINTTLYGFLAFLCAREMQPRWRSVVVMGMMLMVVSIAFSRLYLGAHWLSDVAAGLAFGIAWLALLAIAYLRHDPPKLPVKGLATVFFTTLILVGGTHIALRYPLDVQRYAIQLKTHMLSASQWWQRSWQELPARRVDLEGDLEEPLTVQWAGNLKSLTEQLRRQGWRIPPAWTLDTTLTWLASPPDPGKLPVLAQLEDGRPPALTLIYPQLDKGVFGARLVLRLWATNFMLRAPQSTLQPLWIGTVVEQQLQRPFALLTVALVSADVNEPRNKLAASLNVDRFGQRRHQAGKNWDGKVLLAHDSAISVAIAKAAR